MSVFSENTLQIDKLKLQIRQHHHLKRLYLKPRYSFLSPPKEVKKVPIPNNITATKKEAIDRLQENSCLTRGCIIANTIMAVPIFKTVFPSSLRPLIGFIKKFKHNRRWKTMATLFEVAEEISRKTGVKTEEAFTVLNALGSSAIAVMKEKGNRLHIPNLGTFKIEKLPRKRKPTLTFIPSTVIRKQTVLEA